MEVKELARCRVCGAFYPLDRPACPECGADNRPVLADPREWEPRSGVVPAVVITLAIVALILVLLTLLWLVAG